MQQQRTYFQSGETLSVAFRIKMLQRLKEAVKCHEPEIMEALQKDLGKSNFESYMCEVGMVLSELAYMIKHVKRFSGKRRVRTPLAQFAASSYQKACPYGRKRYGSIPWKNRI